MKRDHSDSNASELCDALREMGYHVVRVSSAVQTRAGVPDTFVAKNGRWHALEIKSLGGRLRPSQIAFAMSLKNRGCYHVATGSWEADLQIKDCGSRVPARYDPDAKP